MMLSKVEAINLVKGPYGQTLLKTASSYIAPIYFATNEPPQISNGTIFFTDLGEGPLAITAAHVYDGYIEKRIIQNNISCKILNEVFIPSFIRHLSVTL